MSSFEGRDVELKRRMRCDCTVTTDVPSAPLSALGKRQDETGRLAGHWLRWRDAALCLLPRLLRSPRLLASMTEGPSATPCRWGPISGRAVGGPNASRRLALHFHSAYFHPCSSAPVAALQDGTLFAPTARTVLPHDSFPSPIIVELHRATRLHPPVSPVDMQQS